ncbi:MAG: HAD-IB family phosphatase [Clostridia bacterium]|nr:HAD-IB family phosphatase [Clostridia bacterium]
MAKTLFSEVLVLMMDSFGVKVTDLVRADGDDCVTETSVRSWRSRGLPKKNNFEKLADAFVQCVNEVGNLEVYQKSVQTLSASLATLAVKYKDIPPLVWEKNKSVEQNIHEIFRQAFLLSSTNTEGRREGAGGPVRVVAFDVDGTLLKGFRYSWTILWQAIGGTSAAALRLKEDFVAGKISYPQWCKADCDELKAGGLTIEKMREALKNSGARLTKNLREAVLKLKENGCKVVIISGGADCILYEMLPDAKELFDKIYINRFVFDEYTGRLKDIIPTKYDWDMYAMGVEGKQAGFEKLCNRFHAKLKNSVFVGDDQNDFDAMAKAGMKIFYHTYSAEDPQRSFGDEEANPWRKMPSGVIIEQCDDLMVVADRILRWDFR